MPDDIDEMVAGYGIPTCCSHRRLLIDDRERLREALNRIANAPAGADASMMRATALDALEGVDQG